MMLPRSIAFLSPTLLFAALGCHGPRERAISELSNQVQSLDVALCPWAQPATAWEQIVSISTLPEFTPKQFTDYFAATDLLTPDQVRHDLACLKLIYQTSYSGTEFFRTQDSPVDLIARVEALAASIQQPISKKSFVLALRSLHDGALDKHMAFGFYSLTLYYQNLSEGVAAYEYTTDYGEVAENSQFLTSEISFTRSGEVFVAETPTGKLSILSCDRSEPLAVVKDDLSYNYRFIAYRLLSEIAELPISINCRSNGGIAVALNYVEETSQTLPATPAALIVHTLDSGIEYLRIAHFPENVTQVDRAYAASLAQRDMPMIIDVRGIDDGGADPLKSMLTDALLTPDQQLKGGTSTQKMSILTFAGYRGYYLGEVGLAQVRPLQPGETREMAIAAAQEKLDSFDQLIQANIGEFPHLQEFVADTSDMIASGSRTLPFRNPIVILTDRKCASQCEFFVSAMRHHPMVTVMGLPTAGLLQFASSVKFYLPNSAVQMVSSTKFTEFLPAAREGEGIKPSYMIANSDWIKTAISIIQSKLAKK